MASAPFQGSNGTRRRVPFRFAIGPLRGPGECRWFYPGVHCVHPRLSIVRPLRGRRSCGVRAPVRVVCPCTLRGPCPGACGVCRAACEVRAPVHVPFAARPAVPVHGSCAPVISPPRTGGPEGVQPCLAPGERSEPGGLCGLSIASAPFQGSNGTRRRTTVPVCYWTTLGPGTGSCLYSGVRRRGEACPCPQFRRPQELPLHMQSPPPLSTRQLLPHKMYRRVRT